MDPSALWRTPSLAANYLTGKQNLRDFEVQLLPHVVLGYVTNGPEVRCFESSRHLRNLPKSRKVQGFVPRSKATTNTASIGATLWEGQTLDPGAPLTLFSPIPWPTWRFISEASSIPFIQHDTRGVSMRSGCTVSSNNLPGPIFCCWYPCPQPRDCLVLGETPGEGTADLSVICQM